eukprot:s11_g48.t1
MASEFQGVPPERSSASASSASSPQADARNGRRDESTPSVVHNMVSCHAGLGAGAIDSPVPWRSNGPLLWSDHFGSELRAPSSERRNELDVQKYGSYSTQHLFT